MDEGGPGHIHRSFARDMGRLRLRDLQWAVLGHGANRRGPAPSMVAAPVSAEAPERPFAWVGLRVLNEGHAAAPEPVPVRIPEPSGVPVHGLAVLSHARVVEGRARRHDLVDGRAG